MPRAHAGRRRRLVLAGLLATAMTGALLAFGGPAQAAADVDPPSQPSNPRWTDDTGLLVESTSAGDDTLRGAWTASRDAASGVRDYRVQLSRTPEFDVVLSDRYTDSPSAYATFGAQDGVEYGGSYFFRVAARDAAGNVSGWSPPSNQVNVREEQTGPAIAHAPVTTAWYGRPIPISMVSTCTSAEACSATLLHRATTIAQKLIGTVALDGGFERVAMTRGAVVTLNGKPALEWSAEIPARVVTTTGVDYALEVEDTFAVARFPGTTYVASVQGGGSYLHVHTVTPPLLEHSPPAFGRSDQPLPLTLRAVCSTGACEATMYYRTTTELADVAITTNNGELLATPDWPRVTMTAQDAPTALDAGGELVTWSAEIPASFVDTRGVDYFFRVTDGHTQAWLPGTTYEGWYVPLDGMRTGWYHTHVLETPHIVHSPVGTAAYRQPITIAAQANCPATRRCVATLWYRTTTTDVFDWTAVFEQAPMDVVRFESVDGNDLVTASGTIPASFADTRGVDYFFSITDGATTTWWPGTSHVDGYVPVEGVRAGYQHTRVLEPPHLVHVPHATAPALQDLVVDTDLTCATEACTAELTYTSYPHIGAMHTVTIPMARTGVRETTAAGRLETWRATIPGEHVTTRGVDYMLTARDGYTSTAAPGTFYWGAYVPLDGQAVSAAGLTVMFPVHVTEPPHPVHVPVASSEYGRSIDVEVTSNCSTPGCSATLQWRTTGHPWQAAAMPQAAAPAGDLTNEVWTWRATIPAQDVTVEGVDYRVTVDDGYASASTPTWHVNVANARVASPYRASADTYVATSGTGPHGGESSLRVGSADTSLVRFELSDIPVRHQVQRAVLKLAVSGQAGVDVGVVQVTGAWDETSTQPPATSAQRAATVQLVPGTVAQVDVTELVAGWVAGPSRNLGLALVASSPLAQVTTIASREAGDAGPLLEVSHAATDVAVPRVTLDTPSAGQALGGVAQLAATASDAQGVARVELFVDETLVAIDTASPWEASWDTTAASTRSHQVWARAVDTSGNMAVSTRVAVTVTN